MTTKSVTPTTPLRDQNKAGVMFSVVSIARIQRRKRICSLFSIDTESSKLRVAGSSPAAPTIFQQLRSTEHSECEHQIGLVETGKFGLRTKSSVVDSDENAKTVQLTPAEMEKLARVRWARRSRPDLSADLP
jgi:hypothetical protein